jgi:hypothetical protein
MMLNRCCLCDAVIIPLLILCDPCFEQLLDVHDRIWHCELTDWPAEPIDCAEEWDWWRVTPAKRHDLMARFGQEVAW